MVKLPFVKVAYVVKRPSSLLNRNVFWIQKNTKWPESSWSSALTAALYSTSTLSQTAEGWIFFKASRSLVTTSLVATSALPSPCRHQTSCSPWSSSTPWLWDFGCTQRYPAGSRWPESSSLRQPSLQPIVSSLPRDSSWASLLVETKHLSNYKRGVNCSWRDFQTFCENKRMIG